MSLQDIFYFVGIIYMSLLSVVLIGIIILLYYIKKKVTEVSQNIERKVSETKEAMLRPQNIARTVGAILANFLLMRLRRR